MKPERPTAIALAATIPIALFVIWYVYRKRSAQQGGKGHTAPDKTQSTQRSRQAAGYEKLTQDESPLTEAPENEEPTETGLMSTAGYSNEDYQDVGVGDSVGDAASDIQHPEAEAEVQQAESRNISGVSISADNNNEVCSNQDVINTKIVIINALEEDAQKDDLVEDSRMADGDAKQCSDTGDSGIPDDKTEDSSEITTELITPSTINLVGAGDAPMDTVTSISACETQYENEPSVIPFSEMSHVTQESDFTANDTTNLLDNAITDSVQFNVSLPASQSETEYEESQSVSEDIITVPAQDVPLEVEKHEDDSDEATEEDASSDVVETQDVDNSFSLINGGDETSLMTNGEDSTENEHSVQTAPDVELFMAEEAVKVETEQKTDSEEKYEIAPNENNNNNSNNDKPTKEPTENHTQSNSQAIISTNDTKNDTSENGETEDAQKMNGKLDIHENKNGLVHHKPPMHNGRSSENFDSETQIYLEFPSDRVGLLIGKLGRNIKNLKQESGAEIMVHTVPFRDDIQVLQLVGTPSSVQLAASKIQKRFREVPLKEFDAANSVGLISPSSIVSSPGVMSPMESPLTPPTFAYPVPDMSQLRLPDGVVVEVAVSAIADCDCVFLQQYTHPTYHALTSLEHAMSMCYSSPATPSLLTPVQVGLVCVAQHGDIWYRAQVIHSDEETNEVTIKFVDYGGYATVPTATVKQIRADFITLPFQATECYLDNISPPEGETSYSVESTTVLQDLLKEGEFHARISRYRGDGNPLILLHRRRGEKNELVNELLVEEGVAKRVDYGQESSSMISGSEHQ